MLNLWKPEPVARRTSWLVVLDRAVTVVTGSGVFLILLAGVFMPTSGGRRSTRLKWEERQALARAAAEAQSHR